MAIVKLYRTTDDTKKVRKSLQTITEKEFQKIYPFDIESPTLIVHTFQNWQSVNYAIIDNYYYLVESKVELNGGLIQLTLECDYLATAWDSIKNNTYMIDRQEFKRNAQIVDNELIAQANTNLIVKEVGSNVNDEYNIYITTGGGLDG